MKIIFLYDSFAKVGGVERTLIDKANYLFMKGHIVYLITFEQGLHPFSYEVNSGMLHFDLDCHFFVLYKYSLLKRLYKWWKLKKVFKARWISLVEDVQPDVIITPSNLRRYIKEILSVQKLCPVIIESHTSYTDNMHISSLFGHFFALQCIKVYRQCALFISLTDGDARYWRNHGIKVMKVVNPVTEYPRIIDKTKKENGRIIAVGRLHPIKRFDRLIDAFSMIASKYPDWHVDIFGDGDLRAHLEKQIEVSNLQDRCSIHKSTNVIYKEYMKSEFLVLSSDCEGFGLAILEAMSCGLPVVSVNCPFGPSEVIEDGKTGLLSKMDAKDLAEKIEWMITHSEDRIIMGQMARQKAARYKKDIVMEEWEQAYLSVIR